MGGTAFSGAPYEFSSAARYWLPLRASVPRINQIAYDEFVRIPDLLAIDQCFESLPSECLALSRIPGGDGLPPIP